MFNNYNSIFTKQVLTEKITNYDNRLYIYCVPKNTVMFPYRHSYRQKHVGLGAAQINKLIPKVIEESYQEFDNTFVFGAELFKLLREVHYGRVRNLFVFDVKLLSQNKYVTAFILYYLESKKVNLHTYGGMFQPNSNEYKSLNGTMCFLRDYSLFLALFEERFAANLNAPD